MSLRPMIDNLIVIRHYRYYTAIYASVFMLIYINKIYLLCYNKYILFFIPPFGAHLERFINHVP